MARRIAVVNQKGGVGKTTTAVNLAAALARRSLRVLLVDLDAQQNATQFVGLADPGHGALRWGTSELLLGTGGFEPVRDQLLPGLDVVPSTRRVALLERHLHGDGPSGPRRLSVALAGVESSYDYVITDCGPTLGMLALTAIAACPEVLVPIELAHAAASGALALRAFVESVRVELEPRARILGVLGTFFAEGERTPGRVLSLLEAHFGPLLFRTVIHQSAAVRDAAANGKPIVLLEPNARGARQYQQLTDEVIARGQPEAI